MKKRLYSLLLTSLLLVSCGNNSSSTSNENNQDLPLLLEYNFDNVTNNSTIETVSNKSYKIDYVFSSDNQDKIFKEASDVLLRDGVKGDALYMDGFSSKIKNDDFDDLNKTFTISSWIAPRGFENLSNYDDASLAKGLPRLTSILNKGDVESGEGFLFGYGRLGLWGIELALHSEESDEDVVVGFFDPLNSLPLYEWSYISASFNGKTGYISLSFNGTISYEAILPDLANTYVISSSESLYMGSYCNPQTEYSIDRQMISGLVDEIRIYKDCLNPNQIKEEYSSYLVNDVHPTLNYDDIALDRSQYEGDRYRPIYHGLPPAVWMNEPHAPFYYKGYYHVFYQHNPIGPYWSQIRWGHLVSKDMIHWIAVKDAVVPSKGICPEGVWTGGAVIGPDGLPWLTITAGTNTSSWSGQNVGYAHALNGDDPYLVDWVLEENAVITQPNDDSQGERDQFRDPFVWYDDGIYYMLVSTSVPGRGGSANIYTSKDMRDWTYKGYLYECDFNLYPEQGAHWECVILLPISTKDGSKTKYILFDCPQYTVDGYVVDCYYWIGTFDKNSCRFIADDDKPRLFDMGRGVFTGQTGYCYLTEEDIANGKTNYEEGRTVIYAIAQGKAAGTQQNYYSGWAHNFAMPIDLYLSDDGSDVLREPIKEIASLYDETLFEYDGESINVSSMNEKIADVHGDALEIKAKISLSPSSDDYNSGLYVRYNKNEVDGETERTAIRFINDGIYIDRLKSSSLEYVEKGDTYTYKTNKREFEITILLDRSMLEVYINNEMTFTTRIYPKYGNSDYLNFFDSNGGLSISKLSIKSMKSAYYETVTPSYYDVNLGE